MKVVRSDFVRTLPFVLTLALMTLPVSAAEKPVKVYILSGQSNMVGIGQVAGGGSRWGSEFIDPVLSVYPGKYDPKADYEKMPPTKTLKLESFGGVRPMPIQQWQSVPLQQPHAVPLLRLIERKSFDGVLVVIEFGQHDPVWSIYSTKHFDREKRALKLGKLYNLN